MIGKHLKRVVSISSLFFILQISASEIAENHAWSVNQLSLKQMFKVKLFCENSPETGKFLSCDVNVFGQKGSQSGKKIGNLSIFLNGGMPAHHHGLPTQPEVIWSDKLKTYRIEGLKFSMPGKWQLRFFINDKANQVKDVATFHIEI